MRERNLSAEEHPHHTSICGRPCSGRRTRHSSSQSAQSGWYAGESSHWSVWGKQRTVLDGYSRCGTHRGFCVSAGGQWRGTHKAAEKRGTVTWFRAWRSTWTTDQTGPGTPRPAPHTDTDWCHQTPQESPQTRGHCWTPSTGHQHWSTDIKHWTTDTELLILHLDHWQLLVLDRGTGNQWTRCVTSSFSVSFSNLWLSESVHTLYFYNCYIYTLHWFYFYVIFLYYVFINVYIEHFGMCCLYFTV